MAQVVPQKDGSIFIPALGKKFKQIDSREDDVYDSVGIPSGTITAGTEYKFFDSTTSKFLQHTNLTRTHKIPSGYELTLTRVGTLLRSMSGTIAPVLADFQTIYDAGAVEAKIGTRIIAQGPAIKFQSGYGLTGASDANNSAVVTAGVASAAAAPVLDPVQSVTDDDDIYTSLFFYDANSWLATAAYWGTANGWTAPSMTVRTVVTCFWHGIVAKPFGK